MPKKLNRPSVISLSQSRAALCSSVNCAVDGDKAFGRPVGVGIDRTSKTVGDLSAALPRNHIGGRAFRRKHNPAIGSSPPNRNGLSAMAAACYSTMITCPVIAPSTLLAKARPTRSDGTRSWPGK